VEGLQRDTVSIDNCMGLNGGSSFSCGDFANFIVVSIKVSKEKYAKGISWLRNLIWHSCFDEERLKVACSKLSNEIPEMKREAMVVAKTSLRHAVFNEKQSNHLATSFITQQGFLKSMLKSLNGKASKQGAVNSFNSFSQSLWSPEKIIVQVIGTFKVRVFHSKFKI
jgi:Zn-dependent M16 (insulinase) family peptidase